MNPKRKKAEELIYKTMDTLDKTGMNTAYYKEKFSKMSNDQFKKFVSLRFPYRFHITPFEIEPTMTEIDKALKILNVPMLEKVALPYLY